MAGSVLLKFFFFPLLPSMRGADIALIVYDVTSKETAETVSYWLEELRQSGEELGLSRSFF